MTIKYSAKASFDVEGEVELEDDTSDTLEMWLAIIDDLVAKHGLKIEY